LQLPLEPAEKNRQALYHNFIAVVPLTAMPEVNPRFPHINGDVIILEVADNGNTTGLKHISDEHLADVGKVLKETGLLLRGVEGLV